ncbi:type II toxin-antitoxin system prevent-host-death family antitoxin [Streptomyces pseudovenezuelae]|uniref:type II toxin-antitoxin system prevent-host-death family antitoxin n=1 Tax=Streptomyces pseudovenezuelae TaxID=67350 RepID=UPI003828EA26
MSESDVERMGVSDARANLTDVIARVRLLGLQVVLTRREKPQAVLVSPEFHEQAIRDRAIIDELHRRTEEPAGDAKAHDHIKARTVREALHAAALAVDA